MNELFSKLADHIDDSIIQMDEDDKRQKDLFEEAKTATLEPWDFAILEMIRREDMTVAMKVGTMRFTRSTLRLYAHGLIGKIDRESTFDERERLNAFLNSPQFKAYADNVNDTATKQDRLYFKDVAEIMQEKDTSNMWDLIDVGVSVHGIAKTCMHWHTNMWDLTDAGMSALETERQKAMAEYAKLQDKYKNDPAGFHNSKGNEAFMPLLLAMGISGPMTGYNMATFDHVHSMSAGGVEFVDLGFF